MITWMTPALVTLKVGLIIEIGSPLRLALLGVLQLQLPDPDDGRRRPQGRVPRRASTSRGRCSASTRRSTTRSSATATSSSASRATSRSGSAGAPKPDFVISVGGFHPRYTPAAHLRLPAMRRMSIVAAQGQPAARARARTSRSRATPCSSAPSSSSSSRAGPFSIEGELGFDVLVQIVPFHLEAHIYGRARRHRRRQRAARDLARPARCEGPTPWMRARQGQVQDPLRLRRGLVLGASPGRRRPRRCPTIAVLSELLPAAPEGRRRGRRSWRRAPASSSRSSRPGRRAGGRRRRAAHGHAAAPAARHRLRPVRHAPPSDVTRVDIHELRIGAAAADPAADAATTRDGHRRVRAGGLQRPSRTTRSCARRRSSSAPRGCRSRAATALDDRQRRSAARRRVRGDRRRRPPPTRSAAARRRGAAARAVRGARGRRPHRRRRRASRAQARRDERGRVSDAGSLAERFAVTRIGDLTPLDADGRRRQRVGRRACSLSRTDAEQRRRDAAGAAGDHDDLQIVPEAQLAG